MTESSALIIVLGFGVTIGATHRDGKIALIGGAVLIGCGVLANIIGLIKEKQRDD